jgi:DNA repair exonuclease SbcCD nuclease subunit
MKFIVHADAHLGHYPEFDNNGSRLERGLAGLDQVLSAAEQFGASYILDLGDLIDKKDNIAFWVYNRIYRWFQERKDRLARCPWISLLGNHNISAYGNRLVHNLEPLTEFIHVISEPTTFRVDAKTVFSLVPYCRTTEQFVEIVESIDEQPPCHVLFFHQEIMGAETGTLRYVTGGGADAHVLDRFTYAVGGHYHRFQALDDGVCTSFYAGALMHNEFGEIANPQLFWLFDTETMAWTPIETAVPKFAVARNQQEMDSNKGNFVWVQDDSVEVQDPSQVRVLPAKREETDARVDVRQVTNVNDLISNYVSTKLKDDPDKDDVQRIGLEVFNAAGS